MLSQGQLPSLEPARAPKGGTRLPVAEVSTDGASNASPSTWRATAPGPENRDSVSRWQGAHLSSVASTAHNGFDSGRCCSRAACQLAGPTRRGTRRLGKAWGGGSPRTCSCQDLQGFKVARRNPATNRKPGSQAGKRKEKGWLPRREAQTGLQLRCWLTRRKFREISTGPIVQEAGVKSGPSAKCSMALVQGHPQGHSGWGDLAINCCNGRDRLSRCRILQPGPKRTIPLAVAKPRGGG